MRTKFDHTDRDPVWTAWAMRILLIFVLAFWAGAIWQGIERAPIKPTDCRALTAWDCAALLGDR